MAYDASGASIYVGLGTTRRDHQTIADAAFGFQQSLGCFGNFDLFAQVHHVDAQILRLLFGIWSPHLAQQLLLRHHFSSVEREDLEQRILSGGKPDLAVLDSHDVTIEVDGQMARFEASILCAARRATLNCAKPS